MFQVGFLLFCMLLKNCRSCLPSEFLIISIPCTLNYVWSYAIYIQPEIHKLFVFVCATPIKGQLFQCGSVFLGHMLTGLILGLVPASPLVTAIAHTAAFVASMVAFVIASVTAFVPAISAYSLIFVCFENTCFHIFLGFTSNTNEMLLVLVKITLADASDMCILHASMIEYNAEYLFVNKLCIYKHLMKGYIQDANCHNINACYWPAIYIYIFTFLH